MKLGTAGINLDYDYDTCPDCGFEGLNRNGLLFHCNLCNKNFDIEELLTIDISDEENHEKRTTK